jgi:rhomboid protease GluP
MNQGYPPSSDHPPAPAQPRQVLVQPPQGQPVVTYTLLVIVILVFLLQMATPYLFGQDLPAAWGMKENNLIIQGQFWRLITPVFLHGSILHIAFNMYALMIFGPGLERFYGRGRYLALFFISGFAGNVMSFLFSTAPSLGSSTAIFGLLAAEGVFLYKNRAIFGAGAQRALINLIVVAIVNLVIGMSPGIDNWGHIGGLIGGALFAWFAGPVMRVTGFAPNYALEDQRGSNDAWRAGIAVTALFVLLAAAGIYLKV